MDPIKDSLIFYHSWYSCIITFSVKKQAAAFRSLCEYCFFGKPIPKECFTETEYTTLRSFLPIIDKNLKSYLNGRKGAEHGAKGGRPKSEYPRGGFIPQTPTITETEKENKTINDEASEPVFKIPPT